jgi:predicted enzyme related to lactoylglutathione lyase
MSTTSAGSTTSTDAPEVSTVDAKLEVVTVPVSDVDQAKQFYLKLGWRLDADFSAGEDMRLVQMTPPRSQCSIHFGKGVTTMMPGSLDRLFLAVSDIDAARADLLRRRGWRSARSRSSRGRPASRSRPAARTSPTPRSATPTATAGSCRR